MRVFLVGAGGFIGGEAARALEAAGHEVLPHRRSASGDLLPSSIPGSFDVAVNAAGRLGAPGISRDELRAANTGLPVMLGRECASRGVPMIHLSTPGVAGLTGGSREDSPPAPWGVYEESKAEAESILQSVLPPELLTILRPDFVYGPGDRHKLSLFRQVRRGWFPLVGLGGVKLRPTFAGDVSRAVLASLPGGILGPGLWNIGGPEVVSVAELVRAVAAAEGVRLATIPVPRVIFGIVLALGPLAPRQLSRSRLQLFGKDHWVDIARASDAGFHPETGLADGLSRTVSWYKSEGLL